MIVYFASTGITFFGSRCLHVVSGRPFVDCGRGYLVDFVFEESVPPLRKLWFRRLVALYVCLLILSPSFELPTRHFKLVIVYALVLGKTFVVMHGPSSWVKAHLLPVEIPCLAVP